MMKSGMAVAMLFKPRVEATEQMTQAVKKQDILQSKNQQERKIACA